MGVYIKGLSLNQLERNDGIIWGREGIKIPSNRVVEVSEPHGRLIDADAIDYDDYKEQGFTNRECVVSLIINGEQSTVIEAEGE